MKLESKVTALERASTASTKLCSVVYKAGQGPEGEIMLPVDKALQEARTGHVKEIHFPLTFMEEQAERVHTANFIESWFVDYRDRIRRDTPPVSAGNLILCSKPVIFARQAPPRGRVGGNFITEDGVPFHQSEWRDILHRYNAGFIIVRDYDESQEPWYKDKEQKMKHLIEITDRFVSMANAYETRKKDAAERIVSLGDELQQAKDAMNTAAANDDMAGFQEAEARVRYLTARIEAAKCEQMEPFFSSKDEAAELAREYHTAVTEAITPLYTRFQAALDELAAVLDQLDKIQTRARVGMASFRSHALAEANLLVSPWSADHGIRKCTEDLFRHVHSVIGPVLNK